MDLTDESRQQAMACKLGLAPKILGWNREMILMEHADGVALGDRMKLDADDVGMVLEACFRLDRAGIDHGQLSDASHHVILGNMGPIFIDFGHASTVRRPRNLTSLTSYLLNRLHINPKKHKELLDLLRRYSQTHDIETYQRISEYILFYLPLG
jgi:putative serine/threonine protein kinase